MREDGYSIETGETEFKNSKIDDKKISVLIEC
jgi:hypothetical protein